jgi:hypothetical protein
MIITISARAAKACKLPTLQVANVQYASGVLPPSSLYSLCRGLDKGNIIIAYYYYYHHHHHHHRSIVG